MARPEMCHVITWYVMYYIITWTYAISSHHGIPLTQEIRLEIFGSPDLPDFRADLSGDGNPIYSGEISIEIVGSPVKTCLMRV